MSETVLVTGASSQLGVFLLPRLQAAGFQVLALSRRAPVSPVEVSDSVRWMQPGQEPGPAEHLVSCGPLDLAVDLTEKSVGLKRLVAFSTTSVLTKADSPDRHEHTLIAEIRGAETRLTALCERLGIALTLIRPTLVYGCGLDRNISLLAGFGRRMGFIPLASQARGLRQPVHADDLAAIVVSCLVSGAPVQLASAACGGSTLSYREMMEKTANACGRRVRILTLNTRFLATMVRLLSALPTLRGLNPEMVNRQGRDLVFDDSELRETLGFTPRPFQPTAQDFQIPDFARVLQLPR
jgi:nucleoside-diphosphate-sugar epimerase